MSRKPSGKAQTNLMSGKGGKLAVKMPSSLAAGTKPASKRTQAASTAAPRANKQWGQVQNTPAKYPNPNPNHGHDPMAVAGMPKEIHNMTMGLSKQFTPKAKQSGAPGPNDQAKTGVVGFPMGAYALVDQKHGAQPDKLFKTFARGNSSKQRGWGK